MDNRKIAFIISVNNELYYEECLWYINQIEIPEGFAVDIICITEAESMTSAYNAAMESCDAKYKVYMHQDVFIYNQNFIKDIICIFQSDAKLGMLGVIGGKDLPQDADIWDAWNCGCTYGANSKDALTIRLKQDEVHPYMEVEAIDGMLMVTQYDIRWREDLDLGWDFYDISQSLEFRRKGYKVGIPFQKEPWCMHDCGYSKLNNYDEIRKKILAEYTEFFTQPYEPHYNLEILELEQQIFEQIKRCIEYRELEQAFKMAEMVRERKISNTNLQYALNVVEILEEEERENVTVGFMGDLYKWEDIKCRYDEIKFLLRHAERNAGKEKIQDLQMLINMGTISMVSVICILNHAIVDKNATMKRISYDT